MTKQVLTSHYSQLGASEYGIEIKVLDFKLLFEFLFLLWGYQRHLDFSSSLSHCGGYVVLHATTSYYVG